VLGEREGKARSVSFGSACASRTLENQYCAATTTWGKSRLRVGISMCSDVVLKSCCHDFMTDARGGCFHYTGESERCSRHLHDV
jgi:hypothetical protein